MHEEICVRGQDLIGDAELSQAINEGTIEIRSVRDPTLMKALLDPLASGEAETIALAVELKTRYVVLDDRIARRRAESLGLNVVGTLRLLKMMLDRDVLSRDEFIRTIEGLRQHGFRISDVVIEKTSKRL